MVAPHARDIGKLEQAGQVENAAGTELPKSFVLCSLGSGQIGYLSQLNTATLYKRSKASGLEISDRGAARKEANHARYYR